MTAPKKREGTISEEDSEGHTTDILTRISILFLKSVARPYSYNPLRNLYIWFGFAWGLPIPILFLGFHAHIESTPALILWKNHPIHWILALHPFLFGIVFGILGSIHQHYIQKLHRLSIRDDLTGLYNPRYFRSELRRRTQEVKRYDTNLSLIMLDIDHFKDINDEYGHVTGDEVLQNLADLLKNESREADMVCRYGGEEFTIILPETSCRKAKEMAERLRKSIQEHDFGIDRQITVSGGVAEFHPARDTDEDLIRRVDKRLYQAKSAGRNQIVGADSE